MHHDACPQHAILSSFTNRAVAGIRGVHIGQGHGRGDVIVIAVAPFPAREVDVVADLHRWLSWRHGDVVWVRLLLPPPLKVVRQCRRGGAMSNEGVGGTAIADPLLHQRGALRHDHDHAGQQA